MKIKEYQKEFVEKRGYKYLFTYEKGDVTIDKKKLMTWSEFMRIECPYCHKQYDIRIENFKNGADCIYCCNKYENSFAYLLQEVYNINLENIWSEKNDLNPYYLYKSCDKKIWIKCQNKSYHEDFLISCNKMNRSLKSGNYGCPYCVNQKVHPLDSVATRFPHIKELVIDDIDLYNIPPNSEIRVKCKCPKCGFLQRKTKSIYSLAHHPFCCELCSDGISYPNKFMCNVLLQLNIDFITEYHPNWIENRYYDFYIPSLNLIIEMDGGMGHGVETKFQKAEEGIEIDKIKDSKALEQGLKVIRIDCDYDQVCNRFNYIKNNTIKQLNSYLDLSSINWILVNDKSTKSYVLETWDLWNEGMGTIEISQKLNISSTTVSNYLKEGDKIGKVKYDGKQHRVEQCKKKNSGRNAYNSKSVICLTTKRIFLSITEASRFYNNVNRTSIIRCCKGCGINGRGNKVKYHYAGKLPNGDKLVWMYLEDFLNKCEYILL